MTRLILIMGTMVLLVSCQTEKTDYVTEKHRQQLKTVYDSLDTAYKTLIEEYNTASEAIPVDLHTLYSGMQRMHQEMDISYRQMMAYNMSGHTQLNRLSGGKMRAHMQGHITGEWYYRMISIHKEMAEMHRQIGQLSMAQNNKDHADRYREMLKIISDINEAREIPSKEYSNPSSLNRERLYKQNCSSCHGSIGQGITDAL